MVTNYHFNHSSLALNEDLSELYSFGRLVKDQFLVGGFIIENPSRYLALGRDITIRVYKIELSPGDYKELREHLAYFINHKDSMIYNSFSAVTSLFHKKIKAKDAYTCCEFTESLLGLDDIYSIKEFAELYADQLIYEGSYRRYLGLSSTAVVAPDELYENKNSLLDRFNGTYTHFSTLFKRMEDDKKHQAGNNS